MLPPLAAGPADAPVVAHRPEAAAVDRREAPGRLRAAIVAPSRPQSAALAAETLLQAAARPRQPAA